MAKPHEREQELFEEALGLTAPERAAFLERACGADAALRRRLEALLRSHDATDGPLDRPARLAAGKTVAISLPLTEKPGDRIGRYKLLQQIGEGGCGVVYMAEQEEPIRRKVALKVIKLGMDTKQVIARFEAERQALALMDHPNIAKVLDAGATDTGRPYFVMELVRGIRITDYCDQNQVPTGERLKLFAQVCRAIQHAHQKGIIHRDIKPSNVLVTLHDGVPVPKVIDFGIAKATDHRLTDKTLFTAFEQFMGTPAYMSPEQAEMSGLDIDTRSDIYSLGVLLYELLTGRTPFDSKELLAAGLDGMRRLIREKDPPRPSTRLSTLDAEQRTTLARQRGVESPRLLHLVRGDLDWIVMKCLEKDRTRRYETANGLMLDVQRHLTNEAVIARPPSATYRFVRTVRRNKLVFGAIAAVAGALVLGLAVSTWLLVKEAEAHRRAVAAEQTAQTEAGMLGELLLNHDDAARIEPFLRQALAMQRKLLGEDDEHLVASLHNLATVTWSRGATNEAERLLRQALRQTRSLAARQPAESTPKLGLVLHHLAMVLEHRKANAEARPLAQEAVNLYLAHAGWPEVERQHSIEILRGVLEDDRDLDALESLWLSVLPVERRLSGSENSVVPAILVNLAGVYERRGKFEQAEALVREALPIARKVSSKDPANESELLAGVLRALATILRDRKQLTEARPLAEESVAMYQRHADWDLERRARSYKELGAILEGLKDYDAFKLLFRQLAEQGYAFAQCVLGAVYAVGEGVPPAPEEAFKWYFKAAEQGYPEGQRKLADCYLTGLGVKADPAEAFRWYRKAAEQSDAEAQRRLGTCYEEGKGVTRDYAEAVRWYRQAAGQGDAWGQNNAGWMYLNGLGVERDYAEALKWFQQAAAQGNPNAECSLGWMYANGLGVVKDAAQGNQWYRKAAAHDSDPARCNLGNAYRDGLGVPQDYAAALQWFRQAADNGYAEAQDSLGAMYAGGLGVAKDAVAAAQWYRKAAEQAYADAQFRLGWAYAQGEGVPKDSTAAVRWYRKAAEQGCAPAQHNLGSMYAQGQGVPKDLSEAAKWFRKGAEQGNPECQIELGVLCELGEGVAKDAREAARWYRMAAEKGDPYGQNNLARLLLKGEGVVKDLQEALKLYSKSAEQGIAAAQADLGWMYLHGQGVGRDEFVAAKWYRKAAEAGNLPAVRDLAWLLATSQNAQVRDGTNAVVFAEKAVASTHRKDASALATLAAACAEAGRFSDAVLAQKEALALASDEKMRSDFSAQLKLYQSNSPYRAPNSD